MNLYYENHIPNSDYNRKLLGTIHCRYRIRCIQKTYRYSTNLSSVLLISKIAFESYCTIRFYEGIPFETPFSCKTFIHNTQL